jgi:SSS family solute:Na+ symporter
LIATGLAVVVSMLQNREQEGAIHLDEIQFATTTGFNISALAVTLILAALYATWW